MGARTNTKTGTERGERRNRWQDEVGDFDDTFAETKQLLEEQKHRAETGRLSLDIPIERIALARYQPREYYDDEYLATLAESMRNRGFLSSFLVQPVLTEDEMAAFQDHKAHTEDPGVVHRWVRNWSERLMTGQGEQRVELVFGGNQRLLAARMVLADEEPRFLTIPCTITSDYLGLSEIDEQELALMAFTENKLRRDLLPIEEAKFFQSLSSRDVPQQRIAKLCGVTLNHVRECLRLLTLPAEIQAALAVRADINLRALSEVARLADPVQRKVVLEDLIQGATVASVMNSVEGFLQEETGPTALPPQRTEPPVITGVLPHQKPDTGGDINVLLEKTIQHALPEPEHQESVPIASSPDIHQARIRNKRMQIGREENTIKALIQNWYRLAEDYPDLKASVQNAIQNVLATIDTL